MHVTARQKNVFRLTAPFWRWQGSDCGGHGFSIFTESKDYSRLTRHVASLMRPVHTCDFWGDFVQNAPYPALYEDFFSRSISWIAQLRLRLACPQALRFVWERNARGKTGASFKRTRGRGAGGEKISYPPASPASLLTRSSFPRALLSNPSGEPGGRLDSDGLLLLQHTRHENLSSRLHLSTATLYRV